MECRDIIDGLLRKDNEITRLVFDSDERGISCRRLLMSLLVEYNFIPPEKYYGLLKSDLFAIMMNLDKDDKTMGDAHQLKAITDPQKFYGWIKTVAGHHLRRIKKVEEKNNENLSDSTCRSAHSNTCKPENLEYATYRELPARDILERMLRKMKNGKYKQVIRMIVIDHMKPDDVAKALGQKRNTIDQWKKRGIAELTVIAKEFKEEVEEYYD